MKLLEGALTWDATERRTGRYGSVYVYGDITGIVIHDDAIFDLVGKRVELTAEVIETRASEHLGDQFYKVFPTTPNKGEVIPVGVGTLIEVDTPQARKGFSLGLMPGDGRADLWIDPRILYRLHEQTIILHAEETDKPDHPVPDLKPHMESGVISNGDGTFQVRNVGEKIKLLPTIERLGDGLFMLKPVNASGNPGEVLRHDDAYD